MVTFRNKYFITFLYQNKVHLYRKLVTVLKITMLSGLFVYGQDLLETKNEYQNFSFGGKLHYGLIDDNNIYLSMPNSIGVCYIWAKQLNTKKMSLIYDADWSMSDGIWNKDKQILSSLYPAYDRIFGVKLSDFKNYEKKGRSDTVIIGSEGTYYYEIPVLLLSEYRRAYNISLVKYREYFPPIINISEEIDLVINIDMYSQNSDSMRFYMRDKSALYVYTLTIDTITAINKYKPGIDKCRNNDQQKTSWQEKVVYASPDFDPEFPIYKYWKSYSGEKTQFNAITDSLFFEGNYKVIMQNDQTYLFNRKYGHIYLLTDTEVIRIGTIRLTDEYPAIKGHKYIIEDRDHGSILLFAPVDWHDDIHPKPTIEVVSEQEFYERYKLD